MKATKFIFLYITLFISFLSTNVFAQGTGNSPYSRIGIGDLIYNNGFSYNHGLSGVGSAYRNAAFINLQNPALLPGLQSSKDDSNATSTVKIDVGLTGQYRVIANAATSEDFFGANLSHIALSFPVSKRWASAIAVMPYSVAQHSFTYTTKVTGDSTKDAKYELSGEGGIYQFMIANGYAINKNFSLGLQTSYLFGNINNLSLSQIILDPTNPDNENKNGFSSKTSYAGFHFKPGLAYKCKLKTIKDSLDQIKNIIYMSLGFSYDLYSNVNIDQTKNIVEKSGLTTTVILDSTYQTTKGKASFPQGFQTGISIEIPQRWGIGIDYHATNWSNYNELGVNGGLVNSYKVGAGGEYYLFNRNADRLPKIVRAGVSYAKTPIMISGEQINDLSFSIGGTLFMLTKEEVKQHSYNTKKSIALRLGTRINAAVIVGVRGTTNNGLIRENYIKGYLGATIPDAQWFKRRKIY
jgi:long-subunit fatty acid transport protein